MDDVIIDVGVYTALEVDLISFDFTGIEKVIMSIRNKSSSTVQVTREFTESKLYQVSITPEESKTLRDGAEYDFNIIALDGKQYKNGDNGRVILRRGAGQWTSTSQ